MIDLTRSGSSRVGSSVRWMVRPSSSACIRSISIATVTIGMEPAELLQCIEGVAAEFPDTVVDLLPNRCDLGVRRRRGGEGGPYLGLGLPLGVER